MGNTIEIVAIGIDFLAIILAVGVATIAYRKFLEGQFKSMLRWFILSFLALVFAELGEAFEIYGILPDLSENMSHVMHVLAALLILKGGLELLEFSKRYGFAEAKELMAMRKEAKPDKKR